MRLRPLAEAPADGRPFLGILTPDRQPGREVPGEPVEMRRGDDGVLRVVVAGRLRRLSDLYGGSVTAYVPAPS